MLIYLYGPDSYRRNKKEIELRNRFLAKHPDADREIFSLDEENAPARFMDFISAQGLFAKSKFAKVENLQEIDNEKELIAFLKKLPQSEDLVVLVSVDKKLPKAFAFLEKQSQYCGDFEILKGDALEVFLKQEADARAVSLSSETIQSLLSQFAADTWGLVTELDTIALGRKRNNDNRHYDFFTTLLKCAHGSAREKLKALTILIEDIEPAKIFNVLFSQVGASEKIRMADYDALIKIGKCDYEEALVDFALGAS